MTPNVSLPDIKAFNAAWRDVSGWVNTKWIEADIDSGGYSWGGIHGISKSGFIAYPCILAADISKVLGRPCRVMDLGSGIGGAAFNFARYGCEVTGIEIDREKFNISLANYKKMIEEGMLVPETYIKFHLGNFFPYEFKTQRFNSEGTDHFGEDLQRLRKDAQNLKFPPDVYREVDFFYHYQVETIDNLLKFFMTYARPGALLYVVQHGSIDNYDRVPRGIKYLNLPGETFPGEGHLYQKAI